ncbi:MAG: hypothetical protein OFPI_31540 [Osedax symbiont Rs2]|nr:MAG: hypothetical protein OFPI_31540 [Osedax symbiont Rs2]
MKFLCDINALQNDSVVCAIGFSKNAKQYIVISQGKRIFVYRNRCPHLNKTLNPQDQQLLDLHNNFIFCANHSALFTIDQGLCIKGPCTGQYLQKVASKVVGQQLLIDS